MCVCVRACVCNFRKISIYLFRDFEYLNDEINGTLFCRWYFLSGCIDFDMYNKLYIFPLVIL